MLMLSWHCELDGASIPSWMWYPGASHYEPVYPLPHGCLQEELNWPPGSPRTSEGSVGATVLSPGLVISATGPAGRIQVAALKEHRVQKCPSSLPSLHRGRRPALTPRAALLLGHISGPFTATML